MSERENRLENIVKSESFKWGNDVADPYHGAAAADMDRQWNEIIWPVLSRHNLDYTTTMDFACGYGRNARQLRDKCGAKNVTLVDVNDDNIEFCEMNLVPLGGYKTFKNNGFDLKGIEVDSHSFIYSFDAMVHFDIDLVSSYIPEFGRVLRPGGKAFIHHSNFTANPGSPFDSNPHWRNFMSDKIFAHLSIKNGFTILEQICLDWGESKQIDCMTVMAWTG